VREVEMGDGFMNPRDLPITRRVRLLIFIPVLIPLARDLTFKHRVWAQAARHRVALNRTFIERGYLLLRRRSVTPSIVL